MHSKKKKKCKEENIKDQFRWVTGDQVGLKDSEHFQIKRLDYCGQGHSKDL